ncbi:DUF4349 domain-containing protein [Saccharothrix xinjiangensis]|uniref:DUF4349 domain-containing protein n=1 Tax=Saccharothrix xinjiangensis TaxID=204798 RepID=A0ABV9Y5N0_9PSEU
MGRQIALVLVALVALAGCSASSDSSSGAPDVAAPAQAQTPGGFEKGSPEDQSAADRQAADQPTAEQATRHLVRSATVELVAADVTGTLTRLKDLVTVQGGYSAQENATPGRASVTLRVPGERLDGALKSIAELDGAEVVRREVRTEDVTEQVVDVEARLANQRASVERVRALLERAGSTSEITDIEAELTKRLSELESLQRRNDTLKGQVAMATLTVTIGERPVEPTAPAPDDDDFLGAFADGWRALVSGLNVLLVVIGAVLPFALVLGVPGVAAYLWWRRRKGSLTEVTLPK